MAQISPPGPRANISDSTEGLRISIPAKRRPSINLFLTIWLVGWAAGEWSVIQSLFSSEPAAPFLMVWLIGWTVGGIFAIGLLLWSLAGAEQILVGHSILSISYQVFGLGPKKEYELSHVQRLRLGAPNTSMFDPRSSLQYWGIGGGLIAFDYGASTVNFGSGIEEAEARQIVERVSPRLPRT